MNRLQAGLSAAYVFMLASLAYAGVVILPSGAEASATCCNYSDECGGADLCCYPPANTAPCSQAQANYCKSSCS